jgi:protein-S-isoprenylcysteine O-methyltransferase Ste14
MSVLRLDEADEDAILPVSIGTVVWFLVLVGLLIQRSTLEANDTSWWIGAAVIGVVSGAGGVVFLMWRKRRKLRRSSSAGTVG